MDFIPRSHRCLFVYGTLMDDALVSELTGRSFVKEAAVLPAYRKIVPAGGYPYIIPHASAVVEGFALFDVDDESLRTFDRYEDEGRLYRRIGVVVTLAGCACRSMAYVGIPEVLSVS